MQWLLVGSTLAGVYHRRDFLITLFGHASVRRIWKDLVQGSFIFLVGLVLLFLIGFALRFTAVHGTYRRDVVRGILPQNDIELALWILVGIAAGVGEEFIFRGYLQQQLTAWFGNVPIAIFTSAVLFGCIHFYQGAEGVLAITVLGALYGICAWRIGNLRGVMLAHTLQDISAGLIHYARNT